MKKPQRTLRTHGIQWLAMLMLSVLTITSCDDDDPQPPVDSIVELAQNNDDLTDLADALGKYPDLVNALSSEGEFTVFAPTNTAFDALLTAIGQQSLNDVPEAVLRGVLEYHVIANQTLNAADITAPSYTTFGGEDISVSTTNGVVINNSSRVTGADRNATNGVVHIIDAVLIQPSVAPIVGTVVAPAFFNNNFTTLIAAVQAASPGILTTLLNSDDKTLFAPTNAAFEAAGITSLPPQATLDAVVNYHVIGSTVNAEDIADGSSNAPTLNGDIFLSKGSTGVFINGNTEVTQTNISASNGVVHVINRTLLPPSKSIAAIVTEATQASTPEYTQLFAALGKVQTLLDAASNDGNLTVFAPTDAAFQALYTALNVNDIDELETTIGNDGLAEVLQHHIVGSRAFSTDLASGALTTLNQNLTVNLNDLTISDASGSDPASLQAPSLNILATNGVIHQVDRVLIPNGIL